MLKKLWDRGQKSEDNVLKKVEDYFEGSAKLIKIGGHGQKNDAIKVIDLITTWSVVLESRIITENGIPLTIMHPSPFVR